MRLSISRLIGQVVGWLIILFIILIVVPLGIVSSVFSYCLKNLSQILRNTSDVILRRSA